MIRATLVICSAMLVCALFASAPLVSTAAAQAQAAAPCSLLTLDQIKAALGSPVEPGQPGEGKGSHDCTWSDNKGEDRVYLALLPRTQFAPTRVQVQKIGSLTPVTGIGEDAFFLSTEVRAALYVLSKDHFLLLTVTGPDLGKDANEAAEKALALQILSKL
jgi:hypothetical protein